MAVRRKRQPSGNINSFGEYCVRNFGKYENELLPLVICSVSGSVEDIFAELAEIPIHE